MSAYSEQVDELESRVWSQLTDRWSDARSYRGRPAQWCAERSGTVLWSRQREIAESVAANRYTAVHSAHDLGKSKIAAEIVAWWIDSHPPGEAFVVTTAPTAAQVSAILWREITKTHNKANLPGKINRAGYPQWYLGNELVGYGRKPADYEESAFQGIHARYVLIVMDEACGIARHLFDAVDALATNENARVLAIGNPDDPGSHFAAVCKPGSDWHVIHLDGLRSPNMSRVMVIGDDAAEPRYPLLAALMRSEKIPYSTEEIPPLLREYLLSPLWIEERIRRWCGLGATAHLDYDPIELEELVRRRCEASPLFSAKVRGVFPSQSSTGVIPLGWVQQAINRWHDWHDAGADTGAVQNPTRKVVGVDVAYGGEDETAIAIRYGNVITELHRFRLADTVETADYAARYLHEPQSMAVVDVIGIGAGVHDTLRRYRRDNRIVGTSLPFNAGAATQRRDLIGQFRFRNDRAAAWWKFRELLDPSRGSIVCLPDDERLIEELVAPKYQVMAGGIIQIESKDDIRKRLGRSTDSADSVIQCFWVEGLGNDLDGIPYDTGPARAGDDVVRWAGHDPFSNDDLHAGLGMLGHDTLDFAHSYDL